MIVRIAVLCLIAFALSRPAITSLKLLMGRGQSRSVVILLDNSASMALTDDGKPRFETARHTAEQILNGLHEGDAASLILTGGAAAPEHGRIYHQLATVQQALTQARVSYERADLAAKLQQARQLLVQDKSPNREMFLISDNQRLSWEGLKDNANAKDPGRDIPVVLIQVNKAPALNVALRDVRCAVRLPWPACRSRPPSRSPTRPRSRSRNTSSCSSMVPRKGSVPT